MSLSSLEHERRMACKDRHRVKMHTSHSAAFAVAPVSFLGDVLALVLVLHATRLLVSHCIVPWYATFARVCVAPSTAHHDGAYAVVGDADAALERG